jgi:mRNA-degrading endonuclease RelE of RelBE toxin-antitoxin system
VPYAIRLTPAAKRQLRRFVMDPYFRERLVPRIDGLADDPRPDGCKKLAGHDNRYRSARRLPRPATATPRLTERPQAPQPR